MKLPPRQRVLPLPAALSRRELLRRLGLISLAAPATGILGSFFGASPNAPLSWLAPTARGAGSEPWRFLQIFCGGGWDCNLSTDPVVAGGAKANGGFYAPQYHQSGLSDYAGAPGTVVGKSSLVYGPGMAPAAAAFAQAPTAFVNGMLVEVTAHELAVNYLYSGRLALSRSREYPAFIATMAAARGGFPAHVILGGGIPLGDTRAATPPLQSLDVETFVGMLAGPYEEDWDPVTVSSAHDLLATLNAAHHDRLPTAAKASLSTWDGADAALGALYAKRYDQTMVISDAMATAFGTGGVGDSIGARLALGFQVLKSGLSSYVTVNTDGFDTHTGHLGAHLPRQLQVAVALNALVNYLATTNDPDSPSKKLLETTTVLVTSEFNRTPSFNVAAGTDHWQTGNAILLGKGVQDGAVVGSTDVQGRANPLNGSPFLPDHLAASILRAMGFASAADVVSEVHLDALFT